MIPPRLSEHAAGFRRTEQWLRAWGDFDGAAHTQEIADACEQDNLVQLTVANQAAERTRRAE